MNNKEKTQKQVDWHTGFVGFLVDLANDNVITLEEAAIKAGMTVDEFRTMIKGK